jgi:hypothetical protein
MLPRRSSSRMTRTTPPSIFVLFWLAIGIQDVRAFHQSAASHLLIQPPSLLLDDGPPGRTPVVVGGQRVPTARWTTSRVALVRRSTITSSALFFAYVSGDATHGPSSGDDSSHSSSEEDHADRRTAEAADTATAAGGVVMPTSEKGSSSSNIRAMSTRRTDRNVGGYDPSERLMPEREVNVGDPQIKVMEEKEFSVTSILRELAAIQQQGPRKYCILGTRHCSFLHQQIIELLYVSFLCFLNLLPAGCGNATKNDSALVYSSTFVFSYHAFTLQSKSHSFSRLQYKTPQPQNLIFRAYALVLSGNHVYTSGAGGTHAATIRGALRAERPDLLTVVLPQSRRKQSEETQKLLHQVEDVIEMPQNNEMSLDIASRICNSYLLSLTDQLISFAFHESNTVIEATSEAKKMDKLVTVLYLD